MGMELPAFAPVVPDIAEEEVDGMAEKQNPQAMKMTAPVAPPTSPVIQAQ